MKRAKPQFHILAMSKWLQKWATFSQWVCSLIVNIGPSFRLALFCRNSSTDDAGMQDALGCLSTQRYGHLQRPLSVGRGGGGNHLTWSRKHRPNQSHQPSVTSVKVNMFQMWTNGKTSSMQLAARPGTSPVGRLQRFLCGGASEQQQA